MCDESFSPGGGKSARRPRGGENCAAVVLPSRAAQPDCLARARLSLGQCQTQAALGSWLASEEIHGVVLIILCAVMCAPSINFPP